MHRSFESKYNFSIENQGKNRKNGHFFTWRDEGFQISKQGTQGTAVSKNSKQTEMIHTPVQPFTSLVQKNYKR